MRTLDALPPSVVSRAAAIARGPHACPSCEAPTWTEPPVPWTGLRDYVVRCDACERPVTVRVDRAALERGEGGSGVETAGMVDPVTELLDRRGVVGFVRRVAAAAVVPMTMCLLALAAGGGPALALLLAAVAVAPGALWGPALVALALDRVRRALAGVRGRSGTQSAVVVVEPARWDGWTREERLRERERAADPEAVLRELERVLDPRELRRIRALAEGPLGGGELAAEHLEDLLRFRRSWRTVA
ncbi:MAG: hypothetical protein JWM98_2397 [Thermoleophilia bacterium]|nr:hypothetical protein [Thermoleophilia bacterium]